MFFVPWVKGLLIEVDFLLIQLKQKSNPDNHFYDCQGYFQYFLTNWNCLVLTLQL